MILDRTLQALATLYGVEPAYRDMQGRLRKKMVVLKIEKWIAKFILDYMKRDASKLEKDFYTIDMSSKNPRWRPSAIF